MLKLSFALLMLVAISANAVDHTPGDAEKGLEPVTAPAVSVVSAKEKFDFNKAVIENLENCVQRKGIQVDVRKFMQNK